MATRRRVLPRKHRSCGSTPSRSGARATRRDGGHHDLLPGTSSRTRAYSCSWSAARTIPACPRRCRSGVSRGASDIGGDILLGGASAGACLAAAATLRALDEKAGPSGVVLAYGFFHATHPRVRDSRHRSRHHRRLTHATWALNVMNRNYAGSPEALGDRLAFPGGHDVAGFPRTLIINAERDNMRASGDLFASELRTSGVDLHHHVAPGTTHAFLNRPGLPPFLTATDMIAKWIAAPSG